MRQVADDLSSLRYSEMDLKSDAEPSVEVALTSVTALRDLRQSGKTHYDSSVPGQPQTNGVAEKAAQDLATQARKYKIALEGRLKQHVVARTTIFKWLVQHSADTLNAHCVGHDGKVPYQRL